MAFSQVVYINQLISFTIVECELHDIQPSLISAVAGCSRTPSPAPRPPPPLTPTCMLTSADAQILYLVIYHMCARCSLQETSELHELLSIRGYLRIYHNLLAICRLWVTLELDTTEAT